MSSSSIFLLLLLIFIQVINIFFFIWVALYISLEFTPISIIVSTCITFIIRVVHLLEFILVYEQIEVIIELILMYHELQHVSQSLIFAHRHRAVLARFIVAISTCWGIIALIRVVNIYSEWVISNILT